MEEIYFNKKKKSPYINNIEKMDLFGITEYAKKANRKKMNLKSIYNTYTRSKLGIQSTQNEFKVIRFITSKRKQIGDPVGNKKIIVYLIDILVILNNNGLLFKNNIEYIWKKFIQDNKITKRLMRMFFNNPDLTLIENH